MEEVKAEYEEWSFQPNLGSHLNQTKPALEFIKFFCNVISVDEAVANSVIILKRSCLKSLHIGEFSEVAQFEEPSLELVIPQFTCNHCQISRNLDICKEYNMEIKGWVCAECSNTFNKLEIERKLISILNSRIIAHQIQDVECSK